MSQNDIVDEHSPINKVSQKPETPLKIKEARQYDEYLNKRVSQKFPSNKVSTDNMNSVVRKESNQQSVTSSAKKERLVL